MTMIAVASSPRTVTLCVSNKQNQLGIDGMRFLSPSSRSKISIKCAGDCTLQKPNHIKKSLHFLAKDGLRAVVLPLLGIIFPGNAVAETCPDSNPMTIFNMPFLFGIAFIGAIVGGALARQRRFELQKLNNQLRLINSVLKRQARIESYAPNLSYAPVGRSSDTEEALDTRRDEIITKLRAGKKYLRLQDPQKAFEEFKTAFEIAQSIEDTIEMKKAARGMGASCQRQRKFREAIKYHSLVLSISEREKEYSGETEAIGAIADCHTELGDLETAAKYYDKYIERLDSD